MTKVTIDGLEYEVSDGSNFLETCLAQGIDLPYFCWHPALGSVGACRQCAVSQYRDEKDTRGKLVMACMTPVTDGARISVESDEARAFRASVIELLMVNHPHDCPICDEGGECHLQDMTLMTGHNYRRYRFGKRTFHNQDLGPFVNHEMNRCIQCYRCVRFYRGYAGGGDLNVFSIHDRVYFGRENSGVLESEFSGNLVEVCPTGVFTDRTLKRHFVRKWDLQSAPSVCGHCGTGCNTIPGERSGVLRRILNRHHPEINGYFLCDRGRFGYEYQNSDHRIRHAFAGKPIKKPVSPSEAVQRMSELLTADALRDGKVIGIGSPRASLETNFALLALVGPNRFSPGLSSREQRLTTSILEVLERGSAPAASIHDIGISDGLLVLGEQLPDTAPRLALSARQAARNKPSLAAMERLKIHAWDDAALRNAVQRTTGPFYVATPAATRLDDLATQTYRAAPDDIARLGFAIAHAISPGDFPEVAGLAGDVRILADIIASDLREAENPVILSGTALGSESLIHAAANVAWALRRSGKSARIAFAVPEPNTLGLALLSNNSPVLSLEQAAALIDSGQSETLLVVENDLFRRIGAKAGALIDSAREVVALDFVSHRTAQGATLVIPSASHFESEGTFVNYEGRAQRFFKVMPATANVLESWRWIRDAMISAGRQEARAWTDLDSLLSDLISTFPHLEPVRIAAPGADYRPNGMRIARQSHRSSGRTAIHADLSVHEQAPPVDSDSPFSFSMEGLQNAPTRVLETRYWSPGWNSVQALNKQEKTRAATGYRRLPDSQLVKSSRTEPTPFRDIPPEFHRRSGEWLMIPLFHVFGSEELSRLAHGVQELMPNPYLGLSLEDAIDLRLSEGDRVETRISGVTHSLEVRILSELPSGLAGIPVGIPGLEGLELPAWSGAGLIQRTLPKAG